MSVELVCDVSQTRKYVGDFERVRITIEYKKHVIAVPDANVSVAVDAAHHSREGVVVADLGNGHDRFTRW